MSDSACEKILKSLCKSFGETLNLKIVNFRNNKLSERSLKALTELLRICKTV